MNCKEMKKALIFILTLAAPLGYSYSLDDYKKDVIQSDPSYKSVEYSEESARYLLRKSEYPTAIQLFSGFHYSDDSRHTMNPSFQGNRTTAWDFAVGLKQQNSVGFDWSLTQVFRRSKIFGSGSKVLPYTDYYDFYPQLEVSVPLWRNQFGSETRAQVSALKSSSQLEQVLARIEKVKKEIEMASAFYRYGIQKNLYDLAKKNLNRSEKLYQWIGVRRKRNLVDNSDALQAKSALALRRLEFDKAERDLRLAQFDFNSLRSGSSDLALPANLDFQLIKAQDLEKLTKKKMTSLLEKLKTLETESRKAKFQTDVESVTPRLDFTGSFALQGRDSTLSSSFSEMNREKKNVWSVGLSLQTPLNFGLVRDLQKGARYSELAALEKLKKTELDQELSWLHEKEDLLRCAQSLTLLRELEESQRNRFSDEEEKYRKGRATLFLVLSAEQDFINAQSQNWSYELQCRVVKAQTNLFIEEGSLL